MPVYEYECAACGHTFEEFQKISDKPIKTCPACKKHRVRKLISQSTFVLKGSGWYATDYGTKKDHAEAKKSDPKNGKEADSKSDSSGKDSSGKDSSGKDSSTKKETKSDSPSATTSA